MSAELDIKQRMNYRKGEEGMACEDCNYSRKTTRITACDLMQYEVDPKDVCDLVTIRTPGFALEVSKVEIPKKVG